MDLFSATTQRKHDGSEFWERFVQYYGSSELKARLELQRQSADDALRRADDHQLVVDGLIRRRLTEEVANRDEHLPLGAAEVHEGQRLVHLNIEARIERRRLTAGGHRRVRERVAHAIEHDDA